MAIMKADFDQQSMVSYMINNKLFNDHLMGSYGQAEEETWAIAFSKISSEGCLEFDYISKEIIMQCSLIMEKCTLGKKGTSKSYESRLKGLCLGYMSTIFRQII